MGGYADAKVRLQGAVPQGLGLVHANHVLIQYNFAQSECKSRQAPTPKIVKRQGLGRYADAQVAFRGLYLRTSFSYMLDHVLIQYNFARVTDIATVFMSLLDSSIPRQFLDMA